MTQPRKVFLAHAREDKERVRALYKQLKQCGFIPWLDEEDLLPGQVWAIEIQKAIREAGAFIACLSRNSVQRQGFVQIEFRLALTAYSERPPGVIYFIPVRLEECEVPDLQIPHQGLSMRDVQWLDLWQEGGFERLIRALKKDLPPPVPNNERIRPEAKAWFRDIDAPWCPKLVALPEGEFMMGSPEDEEGRVSDEGPQHPVTIGYRFAIGRYPVTFDEYDHFCAETKREKPEDAKWGRGRRPVINISWGDAQAYVDWLAKKTKQPYRLPSEAEWEYACRAGTTTPFSFGATISTDQANYNGNYTYGKGTKGKYQQKTTEVRTFLPNPWGLYDMHGNVGEWVEDVWHESYEGAPADGAAWTDGEGKKSSRLRVYRGGSWNNHPKGLRSAYRFRSKPVYRYIDLGFRVVRRQMI